MFHLIYNVKFIIMFCQYFFCIFIIFVVFIELLLYIIYKYIVILDILLLFHNDVCVIIYIICFIK